MAAPSGDGGRDAALFAQTATQSTAFQYSVAEDWSAKIRRTVRRLEEEFPGQTRLLIYLTNQVVGANGDALKAELGQKQLFLDIRDRAWFVERANASAYQQSSRFYSRNANGKYQLDIFELRSAFLGSGLVSERAREFRNERLGRIVAGDIPALLSSTKIVCAHAIPHSALAGGFAVDVRRAELRHDGLLAPFGETGFTTTSFNIDGLLSYNAVRNSDLRDSYLQLFRNGIVESVDAGSIANPHRPAKFGDGVSGLPFAKDVFQFVERVQRLWRTLQVEPPASIFVSLFGVKGAKLFEAEYWGEFDRDEILLPDILLSDFATKGSIVSRPILDTLWQAGGFSGCSHYDSAGVWTGDRR